MKEQRIHPGPRRETEVRRSEMPQIRGLIGLRDGLRILSRVAGATREGGNEVVVSYAPSITPLAEVFFECECGGDQESASDENCGDRR